MKDLRDYIYEALHQVKNGTIVFDVKNGEISVDDLIQCLSQAHNDLPVKDVVFACDDYEDIDEQVYLEYDGIKNGVLILKYKNRVGFINKNIYDKLIKDLDDIDDKKLKIDWDGMNDSDMQTLVIGYDDKNDTITVQLGK